MTLKPQLLLLLLLLLHAAAPAHATGEGEAKASVAVGGGAETGQAAAEPAGVPLDAPPALSGELLRIGVASCYNERRDSKALWQRLAAREPRMLLLLGDNVYADHPLFFKIRVPATVADIRRSYQRLGSHPDFARLRQQVPVYATWDDHDYGKNDGGSQWVLKDLSKELFLDFFGEPLDGPRRKQPGVYSSIYLEGNGTRVSTILLDNRYNLDPFDGFRGARADEPQETLGAVQWKWLKQQMLDAKRNQSDLVLIGAGIQILANNKAQIGEGFAKHGASLAKLLSLVAITQVPNVVFLSGDIHMAEVTMAQCEFLYPLFEMTTSGITHSWAGAREAALRLVTADYRQVARYTGRNFGEVIMAANSSAPGGLQAILRIFDKFGDIVIEKLVPLHELKPKPIPAHLRDDITACAASDPHLGLSAACERVLRSCDHYPTPAQRQWEIARLALLVLLVLALASTFFLVPLVFLCCRPSSKVLRVLLIEGWIMTAAFLWRVYLDE